MKIAEEGWPFIILGFFTVVAGTLVAQGMGWLLPGTLLSLLGGSFTLFSLYFFRDPDRPLPQDHDKLYSPGDGTVLSVAREGDSDLMTLRIFLSVFNVHVQRVPCSGKIDSVEWKAGSFRAAMKNEAKHNERSVMRILPENGREPLVVEQIAGLIARRIINKARAGESYKAGQRYGLIRFGSQAAVHFPSSARCTVKPGDKVVGGITVIGEWTDKN